jgi:hypothetical protein
MKNVARWRRSEEYAVVGCGQPQRGVGGIEGVVDGKRRIIIAYASETHLIE